MNQIIVLTLLLDLNSGEIDFIGVLKDICYLG
jgi:hypothetical protein